MNLTIVRICYLFLLSSGLFFVFFLKTFFPLRTSEFFFIFVIEYPIYSYIFVYLFCPFFHFFCLLLLLHNYVAKFIFHFDF